jgi:hypothetical protein
MVEQSWEDYLNKIRERVSGLERESAQTIDKLSRDLQTSNSSNTKLKDQYGLLEKSIKREKQVLEQNITETENYLLEAINAAAENASFETQEGINFLLQQVREVNEYYQWRFTLMQESAKDMSRRLSVLEQREATKASIVKSLIEEARFGLDPIRQRYYGWHNTTKFVGDLVDKLTESYFTARDCYLQSLFDAAYLEALRIVREIDPLKKRLEDKVVEFENNYSLAGELLVELSHLMNANRRFIVQVNGKSYPYNTTEWSADYAFLNDFIRKGSLKLKDEAIELLELEEIVSGAKNGIKNIDTIIDAARTSVISSQQRMNLGTYLVNLMTRIGYELNNLGYNENNPKQEYYVDLTHHTAGTVRFRIYSNNSLCFEIQGNLKKEYMTELIATLAVTRSIEQTSGSSTVFQYAPQRINEVQTQITM